MSLFLKSSAKNIYLHTRLFQLSKGQWGTENPDSHRNKETNEVNLIFKQM